MRRSSAERKQLRDAKARNRNRRYNNYMRNLEFRREVKQTIFETAKRRLDAAILYGIDDRRQDEISDGMVDAIAAAWEKRLGGRNEGKGGNSNE